MRENTVYEYNPSTTAFLFAIVAAVLLSAAIALFTWHPWAPASQTTNNTTTTVVEPTAAPPANVNNSAPQTQQQPQQPQAPQPQYT